MVSVFSLWLPILVSAELVSGDRPAVRDGRIPQYGQSTRSRYSAASCLGCSDTLSRTFL